MAYLFNYDAILFSSNSFFNLSSRIPALSKKQQYAKAINVYAVSAIVESKVLYLSGCGGKVVLHNSGKP